MFGLPNLRTSAKAVALAATMIFAGGAGSAAVIPAIPTFDCAKTTACVSVTNTSTGPAVRGESNKGTAISAETKSNLNPGSKFGGIEIWKTSGIFGADKSTTLVMDFNSGVFGISPNGTGVSGATASTDPMGAYGVLGLDANTSTSSGNSGVLGFSNFDFGVFGGSPHGVGVFGFSDSGVGVFAQSLDSAAETLRVTNLGGGPLMRAFSSPDPSKNPTEVLELDQSGNLILAGTLTQSGSPHIVTRTVRGQSVLTFGSRQSMETVEDFGEGLLARGQAVVRLDPTFASTVDPRANYLVFITAQGETRGSLYVSHKTLQGFVVRETQGGRSDVAFDYRIIARPFGAATQRLPQWSGMRSLPTRASQLGARVNRVFQVPHGVRVLGQ